MVFLYHSGEKIAETLAPIALKGIEKWAKAEAERHHKNTMPDNYHSESVSASGQINL